MEILKTLLWIIQIVSAISVIILVLLQQGKGADAGATFGSGGSSSLFGASGSANFLSRSTAVGAVIFFVTTLVLVLISSSGRVGDLGVMASMTNGSKASASQAVSSGVVASQPAGVSKKATTKKEAGNQIPD
jgi:preprotein translocase subunit SecG